MGDGRMRRVSPSPGRRWPPGWPPLSGVVLALVMLAAAVRPGAAPALAQTSPDDEVAAYLPSGATLVQEASGDTDGDGLSDTVALYTVPVSYSASARVGVLVLGGSAWARTASHLFGPSLDTAGGPMLAPEDRAELTVRDANADGLAEVLVGTVRVQRRDEQGLWVFR